MKHWFRNSLLSVGLSIVIVACVTPPTPPPTPEVIIPATTKVLDKTAQAALETVQPNSLTFAGTQAIASGDVVVSAATTSAPNGFLRKVTGIRTENGKTILDTTQATLREAVKQGKLQTTRELTDADIETTNLVAGVTYVPQTPSLQPRATGKIRLAFEKVLYDKDGNNDTKADQVILSGFLEIKVGAKIDVDIGFFDIDFIAEATLDEKTNLTLKGKEVFDFVKTIRVGEIRFSPIVLTVGIPITIRPVLKLDIGVRGSANGEVDVSVSQQMNIRTGLKYDEEWTTIKEFSNTFNVDSSKISAAVNAEVFANATLELLFYEAVGVFVRPEVFVGFDAQFPRKPFWKLDAGIRAYLGVEIDFWGIEKEFSSKIFEQRFPIASSPNSPPTVTLEFLSSGDLNRPVFLKANGSDFEDGQNLSYVWTSSLPSDGTVGTAAQITRAFNTIGTRTITVTAKDSDGLTSTQSKQINIINTVPNINISEPSSTSVIYKDLTYNFQTNATDINEPNDQLACSSIAWTSSVAADNFSQTGCDVTASFSSIGTRVLTVRGTDPQGLTNAKTVTIDVLPTPANPPPNPVTISSPKATFKLGVDNLVTLAGTATDPAGDPVTLEWFIASQPASFDNPTGNFGPDFKLNPDAQGKVNVIDALGLNCTTSGYSINIRITLVASDPQNNKGTNSVILRDIVCVP
jgi:hypothetical protein